MRVASVHALLLVVVGAKHSHNGPSRARPRAKRMLRPYASHAAGLDLAITTLRGA